MEIRPGESPEPIEITAGKKAQSDVMSGTSEEAKQALQDLVAGGQQSENPAEGSPEEMALNVLEMLRRKWQAALAKLTPKGRG